MIYMGDRKYWDQKFEQRGNKLLDPDNELVKNINYLKKGTVLDLACGDGRNSLYLLKEGFEVTGVDFSFEALERLKYFASLNNFNIFTIQLDLTNEYSLENFKKFDNIVINHYRFPKKQMTSLIKVLKSSGILFITGFSHKHQPSIKVKENDLILKSDFEDIDKQVELIHYHEYEDLRGSFATYIFKKK